MKNALSDLKIYADGISFIHDQTVRMLNDNYEHEDIVKEVVDKFPFKNFGPLKQNYGTMEWTIKGIIDGYIGWFNGKVEFLFNYDQSRRYGFGLSY